MVIQKIYTFVRTCDDVPCHRREDTTYIVGKAKKEPVQRFTESSGQSKTLKTQNHAKPKVRLSYEVMMKLQICTLWILFFDSSHKTSNIFHNFTALLVQTHLIHLIHLYAMSLCRKDGMLQ